MAKLLTLSPQTIRCKYGQKKLSLRAVLKIRQISLIALLVLALFSCKNSYQKVVKSQDLELKYVKAKEYYDKGAYEKALPLFEELITLNKGSKSIDEVYYLFAMSHYKMENFLIAAFHFKNIHDSYPLSPYAEESLYMVGVSNAELSADIPLDQTYTEKAIDAFQLFVNSYPSSQWMEKSNQQMSMLRRKLEVKALNAAELYYKIGHYKAAATSFANVLKEFPDTKDAERVQFFIIKSYYEYAANSIVKRQEERYNEAIKAFTAFSAKYPTSGYLKDAQKIHADALEGLQKAKTHNTTTNN
jgi:outer membrane protein assembly factor BamD